MARTASSNGSHAPGKRMPAWFAQGRRKRPSLDKHSAIASGFASTSNMTATRSTISGTRARSGIATSTVSALPPIIGATAIEPKKPRTAMVRAYPLWSTRSTPGVARAARNCVMAAQS
jgi:hypothetical protein